MSRKPVLIGINMEEAVLLCSNLMKEIWKENVKREKKEILEENFEADKRNGYNLFTPKVK